MFLKAGARLIRLYHIMFVHSILGLQVWYYRKRGSASYIVREWLLWVVERERETPVTSSISRWNREWSWHTITSTARWPYAYAYASTRSEPAPAVECSKCMTSQNTNSNSCDRAVAQVKYRSTYPNNPGWTASTEEISKKGIKLILKLLEIEKEIVREVVRGDKHNLRKSANCKVIVVDCCCCCCCCCCCHCCLGPCQSLDIPIVGIFNWYLWRMWPRPSKSQCQNRCAANNQSLAVPRTSVEYQCMIEIAGGRWKPFWTGVVITGQTKLAGTVNGTFYVGIGFFGAPAYGRGVRPNFPEIFWYGDFGPLTAATNIYFHNLFYVSAKNDLFKTYTPGWPQMFCMCQGKTETAAYFFGEVLVGGLVNLFQIRTIRGFFVNGGSVYTS